MSTPRRPVPATPALAFIFNIIGGLVILAAIALAVGVAMQFKSNAGVSLAALPLVGGLIFAGILYLGVAEVIQLIARIAIEAGRAADAMERSAAGAEVPPGQRLYLYFVGSEVRGPVALDILRSLRSVKTEARQVSGETLACRVGESEWKRLADFMDKSA